MTILLSSADRCGPCLYLHLRDIASLSAARRSSRQGTQQGPPVKAYCRLAYDSCALPPITHHQQQSVNGDVHQNPAARYCA